jgi:hypothetical protein
VDCLFGGFLGGIGNRCQPGVRIKQIVGDDAGVVRVAVNEVLSPKKPAQQVPADTQGLVA